MNRISGTIELSPVAYEQKTVLRELLNLYLYELSDLVDADPDEHGRFEYRWLDHYWTEPDRHAFFIRRDGTTAGFVMINAHTASGAARAIAEFFVLRRHRRVGVGCAAAVSAFNRFPGSWEVTTDAENLAAASFWRETIATCAFANLVEHPGGIGNWTGPSWAFIVS
jgi:predicted acetyltransferase